MATYSVTIDMGGAPVSTEQLEQLVDVAPSVPPLEDAAFSIHRSGGISATMTVDVDAADPFAAAIRAVGGFHEALAKVEIPWAGLDRVEVMTEAAFDRWLLEPAEPLVGVTEIAKILGVSKQRVTQLRSREDFPEPYAELAAGPVWRRSNLERFMAGWPRRPGRPPKIDLALTPEENAMLEALQRGESTADLAERMGVDPQLVAQHVRELMAKLQAAGRRVADSERAKR